MTALALSMYRGETCPFCRKVIESDDELRDAVFAGYTEHGRSAHGECWRALTDDERAAHRKHVEEYTYESMQAVERQGEGTGEGT
jgi:hypothetical protein